MDQIEAGLNKIRVRELRAKLERQAAHITRIETSRSALKRINRQLRDEIDRECDCDLREDGINCLDSLITFCHFQSAAPKYHFPALRYCPWCGGILPNHSLAGIEE